MACYNGWVSAERSWSKLQSPNPVLSVVTRSGRVESWHRGAVAVFHDGSPAVLLGNTDLPIFARSAVKPLQALPLLERGLQQRLGLPAEELAVLCASHDGADQHVAAVRSFLARGDLTEKMLGCGPHAPFAKSSRLEMLARGDKPLKVHNNCSGKHTGFLHLAKELGEDLATYLRPDSMVQRVINEAVSEMSGLDAPLETGLDGCGAPTFLLPLSALARAFCQLANPAGLSSVRVDACRTIFEAVGQAPLFLAGEQRLCTALVKTWPGMSFAKNGAEGVYVMSLSADPRRTRWPGALGIAIKIDDGAERGYQPVVIDLLKWLGAFFGDVVPEPLRRFEKLAIFNTQKLVAGDVHSVAEWSQ